MRKHLMCNCCARCVTSWCLVRTESEGEALKWLRMECCQKGYLGGSDFPSFHSSPYFHFSMLFIFPAIPSLPAVIQTALSFFPTMSLQIFPFCDAGLQVSSDRDEGWGRGACAGGAEIRRDTGCAPTGVRTPQQHPYWAWGAHQSVVMTNFWKIISDAPYFACVI